MTMIRNVLKIAWRNIKKRKGYSSINIAGLAVGLAAFILIGLYVQYELSFDKYHEKADRIYRVVRENRAFTPPPLGPALMRNFPEVISAARILKTDNVLISHENDHFPEEKFYWADPEIFEIFSIPFVMGDPGTALKEPFTIVLSKSTAMKYFGNENPLGKILKVNSSNEYRVAGVFYDMPGNSHFTMDVIVPYETYFRVINGDITHWGGNFSYTYFLLQEGANPEALENKIHPVIELPLFEQLGYKKPYSKMFFVQPITEIHLHSHRMQENEANIDMKYIILLSSIAFLILFIACINYMNLATARSSQRGREVGIRKVSGAQRRQLIRQFLGESMIMTLLAMIISILLALMVLPAFNMLVERQISLNPMNNPQLLFGLGFLILFVGLFAGGYPAMCLSGFKPITVLSGSFTRSSKGSALRNILVLFQFSITIILIICTLIIREQLNFVKNIDVGYSKEQIITLGIRDRAVRQNIQAIKTELLQYTDIIAVSSSDRLPNNIETHMSRYLNERKPEERITIFYNRADHDFVDLFDIQIVEGRNFSRDFPSDLNGAFLVNEAAVRAAEWESPLGQKFYHWSGESGVIVGVMKDFHLHSLHSPIDPLYIFLDTNDFLNISIKIRSTYIPATIDYVKSIMKKFSPNYPFDYSFFDEVFERAYHTEQRVVNIFSSFSVLAILVACLGLLGLASFAAGQRTKEIGIRKIMGASVSGLFLLLSKEFLKWILLSNIIAWPLAYFAMNKWLQNFAYRMNLNVWIFILSGLAALAIALLTVSYQSIKAAMANPVESLRYE